MESQRKSYSPPSPDTIQQRALRIVKGTASFNDRFVPEHDDLIKLVGMLRSMGCIIGFTTGIWDLYHLGHAEYIHRGKEETAKLYPDADHIIMVVGVDTDELTKQRKGSNRPVVPQDERLRVLGHARAVDVLALQYEADQLFRIIAHDVRVISESTRDLPNMELIQSQCAHIVNLPPQAETSTTARIRRLTFDGAAGVLLRVEQALAAVLKEVRDEIEG